MPEIDYLTIALAVATLIMVIAVAGYFRTRVAQSKNDPKRSSFVEHHGEAPRPNRPGTEH